MLMHLSLRNIRISNGGSETHRNNSKEDKKEKILPNCKTAGRSLSVLMFRADDHSKMMS